ncbi:ergothioneine biosynthesis protein EgtB [Methyloradius palustris]|uniref:Ergothioneine biosynthesis protein EgtB n=2 Tax=Methyloradius palustris TaxID=2778876 RepID=A0A8D5FXW7_9PROT|nr:ergothioneine biosynthesis protein EgtB [Methyloradius palustris]
MNEVVSMSNLLRTAFINTRQKTIALAEPLSEADMTIQAAEFVSPGKWHLAHTSWFFEEFMLRPLGISFVQSESYRFLFNSYYETIGKRQPQYARGLITRPALAEVLEYREAVNQAVLKLINAGLDNHQLEILEIGINHEQQHQELFLTDILYNLAQNPLYPAYIPAPQDVIKKNVAHSTDSVITFAGGLCSIGHEASGFSFDNELPSHLVFLQPYGLSRHLVTNAEWVEFIEDGGYQTPLLWLADGWKKLKEEDWQMPLYWQKQDEYLAYGLHGLRALDLQAPVSHISFFEADAFARWAGKRLPTEAEWEVAARTSDPESELQDLYQSVWQWTASPYVAYPGFKAATGAVGEYNGKFMNGQYVLRGSSFATPASHARVSYRNFFYPHQRWQFNGLRLAEAA